MTTNCYNLSLMTDLPCPLCWFMNAVSRVGIRSKLEDLLPNSPIKLAACYSNQGCWHIRPVFLNQLYSFSNYIVKFRLIIQPRGYDPISLLSDRSI